MLTARALLGTACAVRANVYRMRWLVVSTGVAALVAACGRIGFEPTPRGDAPRADAMDVGFFLSPTGDNAGDGTRAHPWLTFSYAFSRLAPGDTLNLLDGTYRAGDPSGPLVLDGDDPRCEGATCPSGTATAPIVLRADHSRGARIEGDGNRAAVLVNHCS
jgi:hypothetical protein